jgi:MFS transporter, UMF1 family
MGTLLTRLALHRPELRAWAMYDWANSAFVTTIIAAVFPIYFVAVASAGVEEAVATRRYSVATVIALSIVAVLAPVLGALADRAPLKKKLLGGFMALGIAATGGMFFIGEGQWQLAAGLFVLGNIGAMGSFVFYDALLPHIARDDELDRVSTSGYALGYVGGGLLLALNVVWILKPAWFGLADSAAASRLSFLSVAIWWLLFSIPLFRRVPEPPIRLGADAPRAGLVRSSLSGLASTFRELRKYRQATLFLFAFLVYNDGIGTIIRLATAYGTEIGLEQGALITAILLVQFIGIPASFAFGQLAGRITAKRAIYVALGVYGLVAVLGYLMTTATHFFLLAILVGLVQGGAQALSRSLFASMIPRAKSSEFFGLFAVFEKFAGILGPALFAGTIYLTGSSRNAILAIIVFFVAGALLLWRVDVGEGQRVAREADAALAAEPDAP